MITESKIKAGQAIYTPAYLKIYNLFVLYIYNHFIWRCPTKHQLKQYNRYVTPLHLDIGVGTGFYLKNTKWPKNTQLSLMDLNPSCLQVAAKSVAWLSPKIYLLDIFKPQANLANKFGSISMNYLLHCLPGNMKSKNIIIENAVAMLKPQGVLFGATILSDPKLHNFLSKFAMNLANHKQVCCNKEDTYLLLKEILEKNLSEVEIETVGCVALFKGVKK